MIQSVTSRASFLRPPRSGKLFFAVKSSHINDKYAKQRGIGKKVLTSRAVMLEEHVDLVAGDFNGPPGVVKPVTVISVLLKWS